MKYYLDTEFNGMGGDLLSLALVSEERYGPASAPWGKELYLADADIQHFAGIAKDGGARRISVDPWVWSNVLPIMDIHQAAPRWAPLDQFALNIENFLAHDPAPHVIADWPDDIRYLCGLLITGPGTAIQIPGMTFEWTRVDAYPTDLSEAIQHNALWDARALRHKLTEPA